MTVMDGKMADPACVGGCGREIRKGGGVVASISADGGVDGVGGRGVKIKGAGNVGGKGWLEEQSLRRSAMIRLFSSNDEGEASFRFLRFSLNECPFL